MNYADMLELLEEVRDILVDRAEDEGEDPEVRAEFTAKIIVTNQIMELVRGVRDTLI